MLSQEPSCGCWRFEITHIHSFMHACRGTCMHSFTGACRFNKHFWGQLCVKHHARHVPHFWFWPWMSSRTFCSLFSEIFQFWVLSLFFSSSPHKPPCISGDHTWVEAWLKGGREPYGHPEWELYLDCSIVCLSRQLHIHFLIFPSIKLRSSQIWEGLKISLWVVHNIPFVIGSKLLWVI